MKLMQTLAELPDTTKNIASVTSIVTLLSAIIGSAFFLDARYSHAEDVNAQKKTETQAIIELRIENKQDRRRLLDDKIFEIQTKPKLSDVDKALVDRTKSEIQEIDQQINELQQKMKN